MTWVKLDDQFFAHPKVIDLSKDAKLLYLAALNHCAAQLTDGALSSGAVRAVAALVDVQRSVAEELVNAGLWETTDTGYAVHDYLTYNRTAEQVKADRAANTERQSRYRDRHASESNAVTNTIIKEGVTPLVQPSTHASLDPSPVPTPEVEPVPKPSRKTTRAARTASADRSGQPFAIVSAVLDDRGIADPPARPWIDEQCAHVAAILADGATADQLRRHMGYLALQTWRDEVPWFKVARKSIGDWLVGGEPSMPARASPSNGYTAPTTEAARKREAEKYRKFENAVISEG